MNFDYLKNVTVTQTVKAPVFKTNVPKQPEGGMVLRVFANGKVYPSDELVAKGQLDYQNKGSENPGFGFDIFKSSDWNGFPSDAPETYLFAALVAKNLPKVSIFGSCSYNGDNTPKTTVAEQGGGKFGKDLVAMVEEIFGLTINKGSYVDLELNVGIQIPSDTQVYYLPKIMKKASGETVPDTVRRDNIVVNPISLVSGYEANTTPITTGYSEEVKETEVSADTVLTVSEDVPAAEDTCDAEPVTEPEAAVAPSNPFVAEAETKAEEPVAPIANPFAQAGEQQAIPGMPPMPQV